jgi:hypothetical protein
MAWVRPQAEATPAASRWPSGAGFFYYPYAVFTDEECKEEWPFVTRPGRSVLD